ncbi:MAG TPA: DUF1684 domain-containing protein [Candidatus Aminicenantes bacterium]|nr:DUF1684 domain-containing protein [Candidatus Aminicenantes bacterium]
MKSSKRTSAAVLVISALLLLAACTNHRSPEEKEFLRSWRDWRARRLQNLKAPDGWLSLAGLFWLTPGAHTMGSAADNDFRITHAPFAERIGTFRLKDGRAGFTPARGVKVTASGQPVNREIMLEADDKGTPTRLQSGSLEWHLIRRGERIGVRLRDRRHPRIGRLRRIPAFDPDPERRIEAHFVAYSRPLTISVPNVLGTVTAESCPGELRFTVKQKSMRLLPVGTTDQLFVVFGDLTNGESTYGGGRFLSVPPPDDRGRTVLDFNRATNPPCAFSPFATCPLPPAANELDVHITAGEKTIPGFGHH